jgi:serine/threonine protein kinase
MLDQDPKHPSPEMLQPPEGACPLPKDDVPTELAQNRQYNVIREFGQGGMGVVYLAKNTLMDRLEVLKVVKKSLLDREDAAERFLREIRAAAKLSHPNVVTAYSALQLGDLLVFTMEYVRGKDLHAVVKEWHPLPVANACHFAQQAALGLQHAFEQGMVHRDVKPGNLILARQGKKLVIKVLDFGLARFMSGRRQDSKITGSGAILGTPDYIAPEQTLDAANADIRADVYSLGCTLYYLLAGRPPFRGNSMYEILHAHQTQDARPLNLERPEVPEELSGVVRRMMAKDPRKRYQTPGDVAGALAKFLKPSLRDADRLGTARHPPPLRGPKAVASGEALLAAGNVTRVADATATDPRAVFAGLTPPPGVARQVSARSASRRYWPILIAGSVGLLLIVFLALWGGGALEETPRQGTLVLESIPADADVMVDEKPILLQPHPAEESLSVHVQEARIHRLVVRKTGFKALERSVEIEAGSTQTVPVNLEPLARPKQAASPSAEKLLSQEAWLKRVISLPAEARVQAVSDRLRQVNPGFDGIVWWWKGANGEVKAVRLSADQITDLNPLKALPDLKEIRCTGSGWGEHQCRGKLVDLRPLKGLQLECLWCNGTHVVDLTPLARMPLRELNLSVTPVKDLSPLRGTPLRILSCWYAMELSDLSSLRGMRLSELELGHAAKVGDISPLKGMPLTHLMIAGTLVTRLDALLGMPLETLQCSLDPKRNAAILRSIKTLRRINDRPVLDFWREVELRGDTAKIRARASRVLSQILHKEWAKAREAMDDQCRAALTEQKLKETTGYVLATLGAFKKENGTRRYAGRRNCLCEL